jgi:amidophosphoribosyltransferase
MCGIVGISGRPEAAVLVHKGLQILQHRGQDSAGITALDLKETKFNTYKHKGRVTKAISSDKLVTLQGAIAIGHTRYSTIGISKDSDLQPMVVSYPCAISMVHNGNLSNFNELKIHLSLQGHFFTSDNDLEILLHLLAHYLQSAKGESFFEKISSAVLKVIEKAEGGYSVLGAIGGEGLIAFRDPHGIRPLVYGVRRLGDGSLSYCFASESSVLTALDYMVIGEVGAGEIVFVDNQGKLFKKTLRDEGHLPCMFEWIYFSGAESAVNDKSVYDVRLGLGRELAKVVRSQESLAKFDVIVPVPDTSRPSAVALSEELGIPYREALVKNRYVFRSFIENNQSKRDKTVDAKFNVIRQQIEGKSIILVDDSVVRGTTSKKIVQLLRDQGAKKVYLASTCPPIVHPCFYGIDFPTQEELIAHGYLRPEIAAKIGVDDIFYNEVGALERTLSTLNFCRACLTGNYPYTQHGKQYEQSRVGT